MTVSHICSRSLITAIASLLLALSLTLPADAHFSVNAKTRIIHLFTGDTDIGSGSDKAGVRVVMRLPGPLAFAESLSRRQGPLGEVDAPYVSKRMVEGTPFYVLDKQAIASDIAGFIRFLSDGYSIRANGLVQQAEPVRLSIYSTKTRLPFGEKAEVITAFADYLPDNSDIYVGDSLIDFEFLLPDADPQSTISIVSTLPALQLPPTILLENLSVDHRFGDPRINSFPGQMQQEVTFDGSLLSSVLAFTWQGIVHILLGYDHLIFVICLVFASGLNRRILWSITGFTLGHSITLSFSFFGFAPSATWFIPVIEVAIALSIAATGLLILLRSSTDSSNTKQMTVMSLFALTGGVGLIHGFGFSAVLFDLTGGSVSDFTSVLLGFNLGIELGQIFIVGLVAAVMKALSILDGKLVGLTGKAVAAAAICISGYWAVERLAAIV